MQVEIFINITRKLFSSLKATRACIRCTSGRIPFSNGISVTAVVDGDGCSGMVDGKDDGAGDGCVGDTVGAVDTIRVCPETTTEAQLDDPMRGEVYDEHLQKEIRAHQRPHDGTKRFCPFVDQIKAFVAFMLNPVSKGNMH